MVFSRAMSCVCCIWRFVYTKINARNFPGSVPTQYLGNYPELISWLFQITFSQGLVASKQHILRSRYLLRHVSPASSVTCPGPLPLKFHKSSAPNLFIAS